jgi:hypothetical protein
MVEGRPEKNNGTMKSLSCASGQPFRHLKAALRLATLTGALIQNSLLSMCNWLRQDVTKIIEVVWRE